MKCADFKTCFLEENNVISSMDYILTEADPSSGFHYLERYSGVPDVARSGSQILSISPTWRKNEP